MVIRGTTGAKFYQLPPQKEKISIEIGSSNKCLRRLERVFHCCSVCETMEDYKEGYLMGWANYMSPCNSIAGLYFEGTCDVISVTMATHKVHKNVH